MKFLQKISTWLFRFLKLQLFISLFAMPILLWWGLPLSLLSPIGNLIFGPALTIFLFLSSLLFFTQLLYIPNQWIANALDTFTDAWIYTLTSSSHPWLYGFATPSLVLLIAIPLIALLILHYRKFRHIAHSVFCFALLLVGTCVYIKTASTKTNAIEQLSCNRGAITILHSDSNTVVIDPGCIGQSISAASWIEYTFIAHLIKTSGKTTIDHLILLQPGAMLFDAIATLTTKIKIKELYLICWQGSLAKHEWAKYFTMKRALEAEGVNIHRIGNKKLNIILSETAKIVIVPLKKQITQKNITFPAISVHSKINNESFFVQSYKYKTKPISSITHIEP